MRLTLKGCQSWAAGSCRAGSLALPGHSSCGDAASPSVGGGPWGAKSRTATDQSLGECVCGDAADWQGEGCHIWDAGCLLGHSPCGDAFPCQYDSVAIGRAGMQAAAKHVHQHCWGTARAVTRSDPDLKQRPQSRPGRVWLLQGVDLVVSDMRRCAAS